MADINKLITDNISVWTNAVQFGSSSGRGKSKKLTLHGVKKLRDLILELAVHGKLVPQLSSEEPASMLLERLANDKSKLVKERLIKKPKNLPELTNEDLPFKVPESWTWCRLQDISSYIQRGKGPKYDDFGKVKVISQKCIQWSGFDIEPARFVNDESLEKYQDERYLQSNDLLWNSTGTGTVGRINVLEEVQEKTLVADSHVTVIRSLLLNPNFISIYISAPGIQARIEPEHENALVSGSTKQVELNTSSVVALEIPLPPEEEQKRIVAKVTELMVLCDQLEQQTEASIDAHQLLVEELLSTLTNSENTQEFEQNWARIAEHFDLLFTTEHSIEQLKQTILQLAVMGKLVPQDPNDEPASKLLQRIAQEKEQLVKDKIIKKQKALPAISEEEKTSDLPHGWKWARLGNIGVTSTGKTPSTKVPEYFGGDIPFIGPGQISPSGELLKEDKTLTEEGLTQSVTANTNDLLMVCIGGSIGKSTLANRTIGFNQQINAISPIHIAPHYLHMAVSTDSFHSSVVSKASGSATPIINRSKWEELLVPIAPLAEQKRILIKANELINICEEIKLGLSNAREIKVKLANSIVESAIN